MSQRYRKFKRAYLQSRFELPAFEGTGYSDAYLAFPKTVVHLRILGLAEDRLLRVWHLEKLLQFLQVDSTGSRTWFLIHCGAILNKIIPLQIAIRESPKGSIPSSSSSAPKPPAPREGRVESVTRPRVTMRPLSLRPTDAEWASPHFKIHTSRCGYS